MAVSPVLSARTLPFRSLALRQPTTIPYHPLSQLPPAPVLPPIAPATPAKQISAADVANSALSPLARLAATVRPTGTTPAVAPSSSGGVPVSNPALGVNVLPTGHMATPGKAFIPADDMGPGAPPETSGSGGGNLAAIVAGATGAGARGTAAAGAGGGTGGIDWDSLINADPVYMKTVAAEDAAMQNAANSEADQVRQMLLGYGSRGMATTVLQALEKSDPELGRALGGWQQFVNQTDAKGNPVISDNPDTSTSTLAQLARWYRDTGLSQDEGLNGEGLFFSGARARALSDLAYQDQTKIGGATEALQTALQNASSGYSSSRQNAMDAILNAYQNAYQRALSMATG